MLDLNNYLGESIFVVILTLFLISGSIYFSATINKTLDMNLYKETNLRDFKSKEFGMARFLGESHNVLIRLGNPKSSWAMTRLDLPNSSSASLSIENGYCKLNYNQDSLRDFHNYLSRYVKKIKKESEIDFAKLTIMIHEVAHCLDIKRDFATFNFHLIDPKSIHNVIIATHSITPEYRSNIEKDDIESYFIEAQKSVLWREIFADVYSIGYLYIQYPDYAIAIRKALTEFRKKSYNSDPEHNTSCWLLAIENSSIPVSIDQLITWADQVRSKSSC